MAIKDDLRAAIEGLVSEAGDLFTKVAKAKPEDAITFGSGYQIWYTKSLHLVATLGKDRLAEFVAYYEPDAKRKSMNVLTYTLQDYFMGVQPASALDINSAAATRVLAQQRIVRSLLTRIDGLFANLEAAIAAGLYDKELAGARGLLKASPRAAGVLAGVVLEDHLQTVCSNRGVQTRKKNPTLADLNDAARDAGIYDVPVWRKIQLLGDIRNLCAHNKARDPSAEEVLELIDGTDRVLKTVV